MNISTFDLNLLRVLDDLLRERNVSRAAGRLALSQPAVSNALGRLREQLEDPLLVRAGRSMQPTPKALELEAPIRRALQQIEQSLSQGGLFDPVSSRQRFRIAMTDYVELLCLPRLLQQLSIEAPQVRIDTCNLGPNLPLDALDKGELDLALGRFAELPPRVMRRPWLQETLQLAVRRYHPQVQRAPDLQGFLALRHLWVHGGQSKGMVDQWLNEQGLQRQIACTTANYLQAAHIAASTDLVAVLPRRLARYFAGLLPLQLHELPFALEPFELETTSVALRESDPALQWLIGKIERLAQP
jgi:DNA-binding transcriptional LysR family regulator